MHNIFKVNKKNTKNPRQKKKNITRIGSSGQLTVVDNYLLTHEPRVNKIPSRYLSLSSLVQSHFIHNSYKILFIFTSISYSLHRFSSKYRDTRCFIFALQQITHDVYNNM